MHTESLWVHVKTPYSLNLPEAKEPPPPPERKWEITALIKCQGPASAGSRGTLRMNGVGEKRRERERERERETRLGVCSRVWQVFIFLP